MCSKYPRGLTVALEELEIQLEETQQQLDQAGLTPAMEGFTVDETCFANGFLRAEARRFIHLHFRMASEDSHNMYR